MTVSFSPLAKTTNAGTKYLTEPGVIPLAHTACYPMLYSDSEFESFLEDLDPSFLAYAGDTGGPSMLEHLTKFAGQLCYLSLGEGRTKNKDAQRYFDNILSSGHGSVLEHASVSLLLYGISRSLTHELVRHRAGFAFSQVSQRYVGGEHLRFVERPEYQGDNVMHLWFHRRIDDAASQYAQLATYIEDHPDFPKEGSRADKRKAVQQVARSLLPNETEAPIVVTANLRAWRHFLEMRCSTFAEPEIRILAYRIYEVVKSYAPMIFNDYRVTELVDGTKVISTGWRKV